MTAHTGADVAPAIHGNAVAGGEAHLAEGHVHAHPRVVVWVVALVVDRLDGTLDVLLHATQIDGRELRIESEGVGRPNVRRDVGDVQQGFARHASR